MKSYKLLVAGVFLAVIFISFFSCQKDDIESNLQKQQIANSINANNIVVKNVYVQNGVPVFKNWDIVYKTIEELENNDNNYKDNWEQELGFTSLRKEFDNFVNAETAMWDNLAKLYEGKQNQITSELISQNYQPIVNQFKNSIILVTMEDGSKYYDMNINEFNLAPVVNKYGIISINGQIFRYTKKNTRFIPDGDWNKLAELMKDNSTEVKYVEDNNNKNMTPIDDDDEGCGNSLHSIATANNWEYSVYDNTPVSVLKTIIYFKFIQRKYWYYDENCDYHTYNKTNSYFTVRSLKLIRIINYLYWANFKNGEMLILYAYRGNNITSGSGYLDLTHTHTKNISLINNKTTVTNHPYMIASSIKTKIIYHHSYAEPDKNSTLMEVNNGILYYDIEWVWPD